VAADAEIYDRMLDTKSMLGNGLVPADFVVLESRFDLQHNTDGMFDEDEGISVGNLNPNTRTTSMNDTGKDSENDYMELDSDVHGMCDLAPIEVAIYHKSTKKVIKNDIVAWGHSYTYCRELIEREQFGKVSEDALVSRDLDIIKVVVNDADSNVTIPALSSSADKLNPTDNDPNYTQIHLSAGVVESDVNSMVKEQITTIEAYHYHLYIGTACVADVVEELSGKNLPGGRYTKTQVIKVFASFSARERELCGLEPLSGTSKARHILRSPILHHKVRLGQTTLVELLNMVNFAGGVATVDAVAAACVQAAQKEMAFCRSDVGKKVARALRGFV
jgi:hypothetical protein